MVFPLVRPGRYPLPVTSMRLLTSTDRVPVTVKSSWYIWVEVDGRLVNKPPVVTEIEGAVIEPPTNVPPSTVMAPVVLEVTVKLPLEMSRPARLVRLFTESEAVVE
jgi:hypothetical protein